MIIMTSFLHYDKYNLIMINNYDKYNEYIIRRYYILFYSQWLPLQEDMEENITVYKAVYILLSANCQVRHKNGF